MHEIPIGIKMQFYDVDRDVTINREPVENQIQICDDSNRLRC